MLQLTSYSSSCESILRIYSTNATLSLIDRIAVKEGVIATVDMLVQL